jgi:hypothetical protein
MRKRLSSFGLRGSRRCVVTDLAAVANVAKFHQHALKGAQKKTSPILGEGFGF